MGAASRWRRDRRDWAVLAGLVTAQVATAFAAGRRAYFSGDDLLNFAIAREMGLSWSYLTRDIFGHWTPGHRFVDWALTNGASMSWTVALAASVVFLPITLFFVDRLLLALSTARNVRYVLLVVVAFSPLMFRPVTWLAAGTLVLPGTAFTVMAMDGFVRYRASRRAVHLVECVAGYALGLLFYVIPLVLIPYLALVAVVLHPERLSVRRAAKEVAGLWPVWVALAGPALLYTGNFLVNVRHALPRPSASTLLDFVGTAWARGVAPGMVGLVAQPAGWLGRTGTVLVAQAVTVGVVAFTVALRPRVWRAWALVVAVFLGNAVLVGWNRAAIFGADLGTDFRYHTIVLPFAVVALALGFGVGAPRRVILPGRARATPRVVGGLAAFVLVAVNSAFTIADRSEGVDARPYVEAARADLARLTAGGRTVALHDTEVPFAVVPPAFAPYNRTSYVIPQIDEAVTFDPFAPRRHLVTPAGAVVPAEFEVLSPTTLAAPDDAAADPVPGAVCRAGRAGRAAVVATPARAVAVERPFVRIRLLPGEATGLLVVVGDGPGTVVVPGTEHYVPVPAGVEEYVVAVPGTGEVQIGVRPGTTACIESVDIGRVVPR